MKQCLRLAAVIMLGMLWLCGSVPAQESQRSQENPHARGNGDIRDSNPLFEEIKSVATARLTAIRFLSADRNTRVFLEI